MTAEREGETAFAHALVIGCGFIGSRVARELDALGATVTVLSRRNPNARLARSLRNAILRIGDASVSSDVKAAMLGVTHVIWAASSMMPGESEAAPLQDMSAMMSTLLTTLAVLAGRSDVVFTLVSSGGTVYGRPTLVPTPEEAPTDPISSYGITRLTAEKFALRHAILNGADVRIARVANVYGPGQTSLHGQGFIAAALEHAVSGTPMRMFGNSEVRRDFIHIEDTARCLAAYSIMPTAPSILNIGSGRSASLKEVVQIVNQVTGRPLELHHEPARPFDVPVVQLDVTKLTSLFPWECRPLERGIAETWRENQPSHTETIEAREELSQ